MQRIGVIGIVLQADKDQAKSVQNLLSEFSDIIVGRMGVPVKEYGINAISVIVKGSNEQISALSGKLGKLNGVNVKSAITSVEV
ncbi:MAG: TM1266 family iron-only hydrogenase system putative regulator [Christensenellales bacterium]